jgi:hypothetical protein
VRGEVISLDGPQAVLVKVQFAFGDLGQAPRIREITESSAINLRVASLSSACVRL